MARFLHHEPCPHCGSRDNFGRWDDGSGFCFGCKKYEQHTVAALSNLRSMGCPSDHATEDVSRHNRLPSWDLETNIPPPIVSYLRNYGIGPSSYQRYGIGYGAPREQLLFQFRDKHGKHVFTQARNFNPERAAKAKYFNYGSKEEAFPLFCKEDADAHGQLVITEDVISAIVVSRHVDAMPALGTSFPTSKALDLYRLGYKKIMPWLDRDKWKEGMDIANTFKWLGLSTKAIYTELDPKEYSDDEIQNYLCN